MTLIVEDGSGLPNANSYVSVQESNNYFVNSVQYSAYWDDLDDEVKEQALITATMYLDSLVDWFGIKQYPNGSLRWPRTGVVNLDGIPVADDSVPRQVKAATCELAYYQSKADALAPSDTQGITELTVDVIKLKFDKTDRPNPFPPTVFALLRGFGAVTTGAKSIKLTR